MKHLIETINFPKLGFILNYLGHENGNKYLRRYLRFVGINPDCLHLSSKNSNFGYIIAKARQAQANRII